MSFHRILSILGNNPATPQPSGAGNGLTANFVPKVFAAEADATLTVSDLAGGLIHQGTTLTSDVTYTLPTATLVQAGEAESAMDVGDALSFVVVNSQVGAFDVVIALGAGMTKVGANNTLSVAPQASRIFTLIKTGANTFDLL